MNVLLVDDDPSTRRILGAALRQDGWQVLIAENGQEAWKLHCEQKAHLVISDWQMPKMDGLEFCRRVRSERSSLYTYFILISATNVSEGGFETAMRAGVDDFLIKPLDLVQARLRLRAAQRVLSYANRLRELEGVIPVCSYCRRLRDDRDAYHQMEAYFEKHAGVLFSHGVCPECMAENFPTTAKKESV